MVKLVDVPDMEYTSNDRPNPRGEIWVHGHNIFQGYYKQPEITAEVFHTDHEGRRWFMTGDIAAWLPDGSLKIIDRKKALFKLSQGEYCAPEKIEVRERAIALHAHVHSRQLLLLDARRCFSGSEIAVHIADARDRPYISTASECSRIICSWAWMCA
jgi:acyl-CoA synthetase (AMP-forming)/AMP-acid ligase II